MYWKPATLSCLAQVMRLRSQNIPAYATIDAGPHVKVLTDQINATAVANAMGTVTGVSETRICSPGPGAMLVGESAKITNL